MNAKKKKKGKKNPRHQLYCRKCSLLAVHVSGLQAGPFPPNQVGMTHIASPFRASRRLGVSRRAMKDAALPLNPFQDSSSGFGAVVKEVLVEPEVPEVSLLLSQT